MITSISFFDSVIVSIVSMIIVFLSLIAIAFIINRLKLIAADKKVEAKNTVFTNVNVMEEVEVVQNEINNEELVAVIAAAIASSLGLDIPDINIQGIRRIPQNTLAWSDMGRKEQLMGKL